MKTLFKICYIINAERADLAAQIIDIYTAEHLEDVPKFVDSKESFLFAELQEAEDFIREHISLFTYPVTVIKFYTI